ncbi:MAG: SDR family oxidoreductase [Alphaproteobacteria bacterium]
MARASKQTVLITGAGRRIGAALARHLATQGHGLVLHYHRSQKEAEALAEELRAQAEVTLVQADLTDTAKLETFWKGLPPCTDFIHNASVFGRDTLDTLSAESLRTHLAVHIEAPLLLGKGFLAQLPQGTQGSILILGDGELGWSVGPNFFSYAVSKHAWQSVIDLLAASAAPRARANLLALGPTLPSIHDAADTIERLREHIPLRRVSAPQEVCAAVDYLLAAGSVTGQVLSLAGGLGLATRRRPGFDG